MLDRVILGLMKGVQTLLDCRHHNVFPRWPWAIPVVGTIDGSPRCEFVSIASMMRSPATTKRLYIAQCPNRCVSPHAKARYRICFELFQLLPLTAFQCIRAKISAPSVASVRSNRYVRRAWKFGFRHRLSDHSRQHLRIRALRNKPICPRR